MRVNGLFSKAHSVRGLVGREIFGLAEPAGSNLVAHDACTKNGSITQVSVRKLRDEFLEFEAWILGFWG